jgi:4-amino-4-deoxy-L-arabinose transferase-like glycosyltransferase
VGAARVDKTRAQTLDPSTILSAPAVARVTHWLETHHRGVLVTLVLLAAALRALLFRRAPIPDGYVYDFYSEAIELIYRIKQLPTSNQCWTCPYPPFFYIVGFPFYWLGMTLSGGTRAVGLRAIGAVPLISAAVIVFYGYRLLRLFQLRTITVQAGTALLLALPVLFISSCANEADTVLAATMSAAFYYLMRYHLDDGQGRWWDVVAVGVATAFAVATKFNGLLALGTAGAVVGAKLLWRPQRSRLRVVAEGLVMLVLTVGLGGWKYYENARDHQNPFFAHGAAHAGFTMKDKRYRFDLYNFTSFRPKELMAIYPPNAPKGPLTKMPVYYDVPVSLHAQVWTDMSFFSERSRHGDPRKPYPEKPIPKALIAAVLLLGLVPSALWALGLLSGQARRLWPAWLLTAASLAVYTWWFLGMEIWALKTKYLLFLALPSTLLLAIGFERALQTRTRAVPAITLILFAAALLAANAYQFAFAWL